ncbi:hypothetical protein LTR78_005525 [Recurvomyces mirabilis]|uniref:Uncharacterized protein n=1 Tax=Recurvomyces mirabilis TaxID=574656 RepID=A0AAE0WMJ4_9PEZI|nr:hypothetical protein LTR78_005525 [Recurvomyces mirabilis]KAK5158484.1 hypothetical protein LTS14_003503 [Recurvomyces mirabilis]
MEDADDMEIDPAIAEAMGFTGFGGKKRKFKDDAFVDPATNNKTANGANNIPLGNRESRTGLEIAGSKSDVPRQGTSQQITLEQATLQDLRQGVKNERGDTVYFQPSFIEDPWKDLKAQ